MLQIVAMVVSAKLSMGNGFKTNFVDLLGLWSMRPRASIATAFLALGVDLSRRIARKSSWSKSKNAVSYFWTLGDVVLSESILDIFSLAFAVRFIDSKVVDTAECAASEDFSTGYGAIKYAIFSGVISAVLLAWQLVNFVVRKSKKGGISKDQPNCHGCIDMMHDDCKECPDCGAHRHPMSSMKAWCFLICATCAMVGSFLSNWLLWISKYKCS